MANYKNFIITDAGDALNADVLGGKTRIEFTGLSVSDQKYEEDELKELTDLASIQQSTTKLGIEVLDKSQVRITGILSNESLKDGYYMRTVGLYAKSDTSDKPILYAICIESTGNSYMPPFDELSLCSASFSMTVFVGNALNVKISVSDAGYATIAMVNGLVADITQKEGNLVVHHVNGKEDSLSVSGSDGVTAVSADADTITVETKNGGESASASYHIDKVKDVTLSGSTLTVTKYISGKEAASTYELPAASESTAGLSKLYSTLAEKSDGAVTAKAVFDAVVKAPVLDTTKKVDLTGYVSTLDNPKTYTAKSAGVVSFTYNLRIQSAPKQSQVIIYHNDREVRHPNFGYTAKSGTEFPFDSLYYVDSGEIGVRAGDTLKLIVDGSGSAFNSAVFTPYK